MNRRSFFATALAPLLAPLLKLLPARDYATHGDIAIYDIINAKMNDAQQTLSRALAEYGDDVIVGRIRLGWDLERGDRWDWDHQYHER